MASQNFIMDYEAELVTANDAVQMLDEAFDREVLNNAPNKEVYKENQEVWGNCRKTVSALTAKLLTLEKKMADVLC